MRDKHAYLRTIILSATALMSTSPLVRAQNATYPPNKVTPPAIAPQVVIVDEALVQNAWVHTLDLVNAPPDVTLMNPGACIRAGIYATGDNRDSYLRQTKLSFRVRFAEHDSVHDLSPAALLKRIKPEGGDFVAAALRAGGVTQPEETKTMASLGLSADHWCVPNDASDGMATVDAEVESPTGHQRLKPKTIPIESFETGSQRTFKNREEFGTFLQNYYRQRNPARLVPALQFLIADQTEHSGEGQAEIVAAFLSAALRADSLAAENFQARLSSQTPMTRALGLLVLRSTGYDISNVLNAMSADERNKFAGLTPLQDPFDLTPTPDLFQHLDMMWAVFGAPGQFRVVQTIASTLEWHSDYDAFDKLRKTPNPTSRLTPSIVRGVVYTAAGWSLSSFQRDDPLVADYIDFLLASQDTQQTVKAELSSLSSNPAFKRAGGQ